MTTATHTFQAEIKQLLNILVHSLYKDREIFLRELISNASDALSKVEFEMLTNDNVVNADTELKIHISVDSDANTITISDTGIGMTDDDMISNLGIIAQSGARDFMAKMEGAENPANLIGQFGVGFYSVFMVADKVEVTSKSHLPDVGAFTWISSGEDTYEIIPAEKSTRGTDIVIHLREDAAEFANSGSIQQAIRRHSDYIAFPIFVEDANAEPPAEGEDTPELQPVNQQQAIWRSSPSDVEDDAYNSFYQSFTLDFNPPRFHIHSRGDAPIQYYSLLYIPQSAERNMFSLRKEPGLKLYAKKVLIQEYTTDLLPEYLQFVQGVVDSEDIKLNVSRESIQNDPQMLKLKQIVTRKVLTELKRLANDEDNPEIFEGIWTEYSTFFKHGVISEYSDRERLLPLLRFYSSQSEDQLISLDDYVENMADGQDKIYYIMADSVSAASRSPHLDPLRERDINVLYLTESVDGFLSDALQDYKDHKLVNVDAAELELDGIGEPPEDDTPEDEPDSNALDQLLVSVRNVLGDAIESVRMSKVLKSASGSPVRLVAPEGSIDRHKQRLYQMLEQEYDVPSRILELNPNHPIIRNLGARSARGNDPLVENGIQVLYQNALLTEGLHPDPAELSSHIQTLMELVTPIDEN